MKNTSERVPVDTFYSDRSDFAIIGLTGVAGSGCSSFADLLSSRDALLKAARLPGDFEVDYPLERNSEKQRQLKNFDINSSIGDFVSMKKYEICYNFLVANYKEYEVVKYTRLLWFYLLLITRHVHKRDLIGEDLADAVFKVLADKFKPSSDRDDKLKKEIAYDPDKWTFSVGKIVEAFNEWDALAQEINEFKVDWIEKGFKPSESRDAKRQLSQFFFKNSIFVSFVKHFMSGIAAFDYYSSCFFYHRFATQVRSTGNPFDSYDAWFDSNTKSCDHLYDIIRLFVLLIDGRRECEEHRRIVIDSIRNSAEALYLRERYSAFYLIAIHDVNNSDHLRTKVAEQYKDSDYTDEVKDLFYDSLKHLCDIESEQDDFEKGIFSSPDTNRVIARSEIHVQNIWGDPGSSKIESLRYMAEQWVRYAALILHPGLVTPTTAERCMAVAFTAKLNSGCLSRQVGAAITNKDGSVRSIGWNEVPHGQVSCSLRTIDSIERTDLCAKCSYSDFEMTGTERYSDGASFIDNLKKDFGEELTSAPIKHQGLPFSYCFKDLHNRYKGEKNQVFTRSLHAEENAILQMSKYGGEALKDGVIYVTASPCELCSKKLYQIGVRQIVYIDPYPGIARQHIISTGFKQPDLKIFEGAIGPTYFKLYQPFMPYKDEINIMTGGKHELISSTTLLKKMLEVLEVEEQPTYTDVQIEEILNKIKEKEKE